MPSDRQLFTCEHNMFQLVQRESNEGKQVVVIYMCSDFVNTPDELTEFIKTLVSFEKKENKGTMKYHIVVECADVSSQVRNKHKETNDSDFDIREVLEFLIPFLV